MERAEGAEGAAWLQWRKVARKEHKREKGREEGRVDEDGSKKWLQASRRRCVCMMVQKMT